MANKRTRALTNEEYYILIDTIREGFITDEGVRVRGNERAAFALTIQANLGLRISDVINLCQTSFIKDGGRLHLSIIEKKTGKKRDFSVPPEVFSYIQGYMLEMGIKPNQRLFDIGIRAVQKSLKQAADYLGWENVGTHSLRKFYCTEIYNNNHFNIALCQLLMQHSSTAVTQRYIGIQPLLVEQALANHIKLPL
jgi:integrase